MLGKSYLEFLQEYLMPKLNQLPTLQRAFMWFQHDGAPPHNASCVKNYLDEQFPSRWIGPGGTKEWPPRSPDLTPLDFFLWGYLKDKVYGTNSRTVEELKIRIKEELEKVPVSMLLNVEKSCVRRMLKCKEANGGHFEQFKI